MRWWWSIININSVRFPVLQWFPEHVMETKSDQIDFLNLFLYHHQFLYAHKKQPNHCIRRFVEICAVGLKYTPGTPPHCGASPPTTTLMWPSSIAADRKLNTNPHTLTERQKIQCNSVFFFLHQNTLPQSFCCALWSLHSIETERSVASHHMHTHMRNWNIPCYIILKINQFKRQQAGHLTFNIS